MLMRNRSISYRLTLWFLSIFFLGLTLFGVFMWLDLHSAMTAIRRQTLEHRADRLTQLLRDAEDLSAEQQQKKFQEFAGATGDGLMEIFNAAGSRAYPSPSAAAASFPWPAIGSEHHNRFRYATSGGQPYLVLVRRSQIGGQPLYLCFAASLVNNRALLHRFTYGLLAAAPVLLLLSALSGYFISRKALVPVDRITASVQSISLSNLSGRLTVAETGDELQRLAETFNAMLARLESAVGRIRQFTGDASHELRGPLTYIRMVAEVAMRSPQMDAESRRACEEIVAETAKAGALLEDMLTLARADGGEGRPELIPLDLTAALEEAWQKITPLAAARRQRLRLHCAVGPVEILADEASLARLFWILLDNAVKYTPEEGAVEVSVETTPRLAMVTVRDSGMGIADADLPFIFQRFYRADPSRSQVDGTGLGLAIAKWIATLHHATIAVQSSVGEGTSFTVTFPLHAEG